MRTACFGAVLILLLALSSCRAGQPVTTAASVQVEYSALAGRSAAGVSVQRSGDLISISFASVDGEGRFLSVSLNPDEALMEEEWTSDSQTLHLSVPVPGGFDVGLTALQGYSGQQVRARFCVGRAGKTASIPPKGHANLITDLLVTQATGDNVLLDWTEVNTGDYDFNSEVNVADIVPLGRLLGTQIDTESAQSKLSHGYWVDGDHNGEINLGDLTPIGLNYHSALIGYCVRRNGLVLDGEQAGEPTILRENGMKRDNLPVSYSIVVEGQLDDFWEVAPVDAHGWEGSNNAGSWNSVDLKVKVDIAGIELYDFADPSALGGLGVNSYRLSIIDIAELMRRLDPGFDPDGCEVGNQFPFGIGCAAFSNLPRGQALFLEVRYRPEYDLRTGQDWAASGTPAEQRQLSTYMPIELPPAGLTELDARIRVNRGDSGAALMGIETITRTSSKTSFVDKQLDFATGIISQDTDLDASFSDEARLADFARLGVSYAQLSLLNDSVNHNYNARLKQALSGKLLNIDEGAGKLVLADASAIDSGGTWYLGQLDVNFDETTDFDQLQLDPQGPVISDLDPAALAASDYITLESQYLSDSIGVLPDKHWATLVRRTLISTTTDALALIPDKLAARPGEAVRVTVYANQSASPFYSLGGLSVAFEQGNYFRHGSFNVGEPGGTSAHADGLWPMLGATTLILPPDDLIQEAPYAAGKVLLKFYLTPQDGHEVQAATGALFNFELICHSDVNLQLVRGSSPPGCYYLDFGGTSHTWAHDEDVVVPPIVVAGDPLRLDLTTPVATGAGTPADPYVVSAGEAYPLMLIDPLAGNVTLSPETSIWVEPADAAQIEPATAALTVQPGFSGSFMVSASYGDIFTNPVTGLAFIAVP